MWLKRKVVRGVHDTDLHLKHIEDVERETRLVIETGISTSVKRLFLQITH